MGLVSACPREEIDQRPCERPARVWRPFPRAIADLLCVEEAPGDLRPRIHGCFSITLARSTSVVRVESGRSVLADADSILLVPPLQLYGARMTGALARPAVTLLVGSSHSEGLALPDRASLVDDPELGGQLAVLVAQLDRPVRSLECLSTLRALLDRLLRRAIPLGLPRSGRATPLDPVRDVLRAQLGAPTRTSTLAATSGLTESHLIRAFHLEYGLPPHAYSLRLRLAGACELLAGGLSVAETAFECGFADQSHLSRKFKEVYGLTPAAWARGAGDKKGLESRLAPRTRAKSEPAGWWGTVLSPAEGRQAAGATLASSTGR